MSKYSMAQVTTLTGISAHSLRIWERRYSFLKPGRTETNIRYYSDDQLVKLLNVGVLIRNGYKISKIDRMSDSEMNEHITDILSNINESIEDEINLLTLSMLEMSELDFNKIFQRSLMRKGLQTTITNLIYPFLNHIGVLWGTNKIVPAQEHFISSLIRQKIVAAIDSFPAPSEDAPRICMFLLDKEDHEIGLLLASYIAHDLGWKVYYIGQNMPVKNIKNLVEISQPDAILSMFILRGIDRTTKLIEKVKEETNIPFLVSGNKENFSKIEMSDTLIHIESPDNLMEYLKLYAANKIAN